MNSKLIWTTFAAIVVGAPVIACTAAPGEPLAPPEGPVIAGGTASAEPSGSASNKKPPKTSASGTTPEPSSTGTTPPTPTTTGTTPGTPPPTTATCQAKADADQCDQCCDESSGGGAEFFYNAVDSCLCTQRCAAQCGNNYCASPDGQPSAACEQCLDQNIDACIDQAANTCQGDAKCKVYDACYVAAGCDAKPAPQQ